MHFDSVRTKIVIENQICWNVTSKVDLHNKVHAEFRMQQFVYLEGFVFNEALEEMSYVAIFRNFLYVSLVFCISMDEIKSRACLFFFSTQPKTQRIGVFMKIDDVVKLCNPCRWQ